MNYCSECGGKLHVATPLMDNRPRHICDDCGVIHYENPKVIVGTLPVYEGSILLCRRAIEPRLGFWTLPAGFLENNESTEEGAKRETFEEAGAKYGDTSMLYRVFDIPHINQVYIFYLAQLATPDFFAGEESLEVAFFDEEEIPWSSLAFPVMKDILVEYFSDRKVGEFKARSGKII